MALFEDGQLTAERRLSNALHDLAQPMTILFCTLEEATRFDSCKQLRTALRTALVECERIRGCMNRLQDDLQIFTRTSRQ